MIGLALFAFVLGDFIMPGGGRVRSLDVAKIGGKSLNIQQFEEKINEITNMYQQQLGQLDERMRDMVHEQAWNTLVNETVMQQAYARVGLFVSPEELCDMITGFNPPPVIRQEFTNPETGQFERTWLMNFLRVKDSDHNQAAAWNFLEQRLIEERFSEKYNDLIAKGIFIPDFVAENENRELNRRVDFDYFVRDYGVVHDSLITVSNRDIRAYYDKNKVRWEQTASRGIEYVLFPIVPSEEDHTAAQEWIEKIKPEFEEATDPFQFIRINSRTPAETGFMIREHLPLQQEELFDAAIGAVVGPYREGDSWRLARLVSSENRPDSVRVRQIIIAPQGQAQTDYTNAVRLADSIKTAIENGADFTRLAMQHSLDPNAQTNGGDIGWIHEANIRGSMMEAIFGMRRGELIKFEPGQRVFIMQVMERGIEIPKVQIATLQHDILPSTRTEQLIFAQASKFAIENRTESQFDETSAELNLAKRIADNLEENERQIPGLMSARQIIRWAHNAKRGEVSDVFTLDNMFVVAVLKNINKKGFASLDDVSSEIETNVRRQKKGELIASQLTDAAQNAQTFLGLAQTLSLPVETASGISFSTFSLPMAGVEHELIAIASISDEGNISDPVAGVNGVYMFTVTQIVEPNEIGVEMARDRLSVTYNNRARSEPQEALRKAANIVDLRSNFY